MALDAVVVADDENLDLARLYGFWGIECPNDRMGRKWNMGFRAAREADMSVLIGSDNWIHPDTFDQVPENAIGTASSIDFVDLERGVLQHAHAERSIPWLIPRSLLEPVDFTPFPDRMQRGTEAMLRGALGMPQFRHRGGVPAVDFCTAESMSPYAGVRNSIGDGVEHDAWEALATHWPEHLIQAARESA